ncbi:MAG: hypothetical protein LBK47_05125 [Prevotellaceae bacterium]|jgi:hypothetical protein|nr:hypothetical protein [Prevotellaceae bacterium]
MKKSAWSIIADNFIELGRLLFAGVVIGGIVGETDKMEIIILGGIACAVFIAFGILLKIKNLE